MSSGLNIHPVFNRMISKEEKEKFLKQKAVVVWLTGLSGSGKSSIAILAERQLMEQGYFCNILDGDNVRTGLNYNLSFGEADRYENIRRIAEVARLFLNCGIITLCTFVSPTIALRNLAKQIIGDENFIEVFIDADLETCEKRDVKGLYKKARRGEISDFTGISALFEEPVHPALILKTGQLNLDESVQILLNYIKPYIQLQN